LPAQAAEARHREQLAMPPVSLALDERAVDRLSHESPHEIDGKPQERSRFFADKFAIDRGRV
jgi:hypothetical protein